MSSCRNRSYRCSRADLCPSLADETTSNSKLIGYQILAGGGLGLVLQNVIIAIQATVPEDRIPQATSLVTFFQLVRPLLARFSGAC